MTGGRFPDSLLDEIRARIPVSAVAGRRVKLARKGREFSGLCPFHSEKSPSYTINDDKGFGHCFGCGAHHDVIGFVMRTEHLSFPEAVERLAAEAGLQVPTREISDANRQAEARRASLLEALEAACGFYEAYLGSDYGRAARAYLAERGIAPETAA